MRKTTMLGWCFTGFWIICFAVLLLAKRETISDLDLNEWGDLFSGFAAPLALIWLIVGYIQQGEELRLNTHSLQAQEKEFQLNTEALKGQQEEMRRQVEAMLELAKSTDRFAKASEDQLHALQEQLRELIKQAESAKALADSTNRLAKAVEGLFDLQKTGQIFKALQTIFSANPAQR